MFGVLTVNILSRGLKRLQPYSKNDDIVFSPHQPTHNTSYRLNKNRFLHIFSHLYFKKMKYHICISIQTLYSVICWSTFGRDYSLKSSWVWCYKLGSPVFGEFLPFFSADPLKLSQVGWGVLLHSYLQVSPEMFDRVQVRALAGHSETCPEATPAVSWLCA
jgi:hypothetical protein